MQVTVKLFGRPFVLARTSLIQAGCPKALAGRPQNNSLAWPIVIGANTKKLCQIASGWYPPTLVLAGQARRSRFLADGIVCSWAWIDQQVEKLTPITANALLDVLASRLQRTPRLSVQPKPMITNVYPWEGVVDYRLGGTSYRQRYALTADAADVTMWSASILPQPKVPQKDYGALHSEMMEPILRASISKISQWGPVIDERRHVATQLVNAGIDPVAVIHSLAEKKSPETKKELIDEHRRLVRVMRRGSEKELQDEARRQARELQEYEQAMK